MYTSNTVDVERSEPNWTTLRAASICCWVHSIRFARCMGVVATEYGLLGGVSSSWHSSLK